MSSPVTDGIEKMLELSTCHVSKETSDKMAAGTIDWPMDSVDYGWLVYCNVHDPEDLLRLPPELAEAIRLGSSHGCKLLKFDCDALIIDVLPQFNW